MAVLLLDQGAHHAGSGTTALLAVDPTLDDPAVPRCGRHAEIEAAVVWTAHDMMELRRYPEPALIVSMGAGVDHLFRPPGPPPGVPVARLLETRAHPGHGGMGAAERAALPSAGSGIPRPAGAQGLAGAAGAGDRRRGGSASSAWARSARRCGAALAASASRSWAGRAGPKRLDGVETFHGAAGLMAMAARIGHAGLPAAADARDARHDQCPDCWGRCRAGGYLLNSARGGHMVGADVLAALDSGQLAGAALDVFEPEPLPHGQPFWTHPKVILTPHAASITIPASAAPQVVENIHRARDGPAADQPGGFLGRLLSGACRPGRTGPTALMMRGRRRGATLDRMRTPGAARRRHPASPRASGAPVSRAPRRIVAVGWISRRGAPAAGSSGCGALGRLGHHAAQVAQEGRALRACAARARCDGPSGRPCAAPGRVRRGGRARG